VSQPKSLDEIMTPAAVVDVDRMQANLDKMARYTQQHGLTLLPHTKTHKTPELAQEQLRRGASGLTCATLREAEVMAAVCSDILLAYPPVGAVKLRRVVELAARVRLTVAVDSPAVLDGLVAALRGAGVRVGVLVELDAGMHRVGVVEVEDAVALARAVADAPEVDYAGVMFYPGHIREHVSSQAPSIESTNLRLASFIDALTDAGLVPARVSGGSTPTAYSSPSHQRDPAGHLHLQRPHHRAGRRL
jgi:D-serine deaminase-like pyridoxal phosphate-dependent protein